MGEGNCIRNQARAQVNKIVCQAQFVVNEKCNEITQV
jgi:hypothetical protein